VVVNNNYNSINKVNANKPASNVQKPFNPTTSGFGAVLQESINKNESLKFSKHAELRLQSRNISLTQAQKDKMKEAVSRAESKGVKDSLVLMDNLAFVVNVKSKTVITAVNSSELKENVFTNIDGAVIV
jgi:flagellar operon protein